MVTPASLNEALDLLGGEPGEWLPFAGGTDLMVLLEAGKLTHRNFVNIWPFGELRGIEVSSAAVTLGALTSYSEVQKNKMLRDEFPMLCQAASETGGVAVQNRGTLGGNIMNASPAADSPPALLAYDAEIELVSSTGSRWLPYREFHTGYKEMNCNPGELLSRIRLPRSNRPTVHYYRKVGPRRAQAISKVCFAATASMQSGRIADVRIAFGSVAPTAVRCLGVEDLLRGNALNTEIIGSARSGLSAEILPIDDIRSTAKYRERVAANLLVDFLECLEATSHS